jgi:hypothetical protein
MHIPWNKSVFAALLMLCLPLALFGCGGGGGGGGDTGGETTTVTGLATKGPIKGALVQISEVTTGGQAGSLLGSGLSGTDGRFAIAIPAAAAAEPRLITVTGQANASYLSESTGTEESFGPGESFRTLVPAGGASTGVTVSPLTEAAYQKLQQILTENVTLATPANLSKAMAAANSRIAALAGVVDILADPAGDIRHRAFLLILDQMIVDQGGQANTATLLNILNQAYVDVTAPAYQNYLQAFNGAALTVQAANAGNAPMVAAVQQARIVAGNPPPEPNFTDVTPPTAPVRLSATASALSATAASVLLDWEASSDNDQVAGYDVFRDGAKIATVLTPGYTDTAVSFNVTFSYFVVAFDAVGNRSAASNLASATPLVPPLDVTVSGQVDTLTAR